MGLLLLLSNGSFALYGYVNPVEPAPLPEFALGAHLIKTGHYTDFPSRIWGEHLRYAHTMTGDGGWVVQVVQWDDLKADKWSAFIAHAEALNLRVVLRLATRQDDSGHWERPFRDPNGAYRFVAREWASFFEQLRFSNTLWVTIGNEPNSGAEWGGMPDPAAYAKYFLNTAQAIHRLGRDIKIAPAALDLYAPHTNGQPFPGLDFGMMDAAAFWDGVFFAQPRLMDYVDFWASHVYPWGPFKGPPWIHEQQIDRILGAENLHLRQAPDNIAIRGVNGYQWEAWYLKNRFGIDLPPTLITEFGYRYEQKLWGSEGDAGNAELDPATAAAYLDMAIYGNDGRYPDAPREGWTPLITADNVIGVVYFALAGAPERWAHTNLLQVDRLGRVIGTYPHYDVLVRRTHATN